MKRVVFKIRGMDCAEEVTMLKKAIRPLVGDETHLVFDLLNGTMTVQLADDTCRQETIQHAVAHTGMTAIPLDDAQAKDPEGETFWQRRGRTLLCMMSGCALAGGVLWHALHHGSFLGALTAGYDSEGDAFPLISLVLYLASVVSGAWFVAPKAFYAARSFRPDMHVLMMIAVIGAVGIGEWFEAATVTFLFALALLLESWSVGRARLAIQALIALSPITARCLQDNGDVLERPVEDVPVGATIVVRPGEQVPLDGIVTRGATSMNQAPITGESVPVSKAMGDPVFAGTINGDGVVECQTTTPAADTTLARIIRMVETAHARRAPSEQWVERFARIYTPAMMALAVLIAVIPPLLFGGTWGTWFYEALVILVIACPCALVISTPVSIVAGLTAAARAGVLIKGGASLEASAHIQVVAFDKTGTLTYGEPVVQAIMPLNGHTERELLACAAALEAHSSHPLARAILDKAKALGLSYTPAMHVTVLQGRGAEAIIDGKRFWIGSHRLMEEVGVETTSCHDIANRVEDAGHSLVAIGTDAHICGLVSVADSVRPTAVETVQALKHLGISRVAMLSGDNQGTAQAVAAATGVDWYRAELLPEEKVQCVDALAREFGAVAMVGDGVNDAPAMAAATLGIAMGAMGTDAAIETADVALMSDDLTKVPWLIRHARRTLAVIKQNIYFALGLKLTFVVLALVGVATLWMAIAADMGASLLVIFNSLRLVRERGA